MSNQGATETGTPAEPKAAPKIVRLSRNDKLEMKKVEDKKVLDLLTVDYKLDSEIVVDEETKQEHKSYHVQNLNFGIGERVLLKDSSFKLQIGRKYGIVGKNGTGKTFFLKALAHGIIKLDDNLTIHLVEEELVGDETTIVECFAKTKLEQKQLIEEVKEYETRPKSRKNDTYQPSTRTIVIASLGFKADNLETMACNLSGGWRMRISLAMALITEPDILLLDEPSNMLDYQTVVWLQNHLKNWKKGLIFTSHDRFFLDWATTDVLFVNDDVLEHHTMTHRDFDRIRREDFLTAKAAYDRNMNQRKELNDFIKDKKSKKKDVEAKKLELKNLPKAELPVEKDKETWTINASQKIKCATIETLDLCFGYNSYSRLVIRDVNVRIEPDSKIVILGANGCGKTTLLKLFIKKLKPISGDVFLHPNVNVGYFSQHTIEEVVEHKTNDEMIAEFSRLTTGGASEKEETEEVTAIDFLRRMFPNAEDASCKNNLKKFGVPDRDHNMPLRCLSSGQRSRVVFASIFMQKPNFLILDEPTSHLDMEGTAALLDAIRNFRGGVILVTHDGRMMSNVVTDLWYINDGKVTIVENGAE